MKVREKSPIIVDYYPYVDSLRDKILRDCDKVDFTKEVYNWDGGITNVRASQTHPMKSVKKFPSVKLLLDYILNLIRTGDYLISSHIPFEVDHFWITKYEKGDYTLPHHHYPSVWSFVYFVTAPKGSSPLVFPTSGKRIKAEDGKVVVFPGHVEHSVPKNKCDGRMVVAGNVMYPYSPYIE